MYDKVLEFAIKKGYQSIDYLGEWNGYKCYEPILRTDGTSFIGLPLMILEDGDGNIRMSTSQEALQQIKDVEH